LPHEDQLQEWKDEIKSYPSYHSPVAQIPDYEIEEAFFNMFNYTHFFCGQDKATLIPVSLYMLDEQFDNEWKKQNWKNPTISTLSNRFRSERFWKYLDSIQNCDNATKIHNFIDGNFRDAWKLQSDGDQTNATLVRASIIAFATTLSNFIVNGDHFVDLGSSYGSLLWIPVSIINANSLNGITVSGEGWETFSGDR